MCTPLYTIVHHLFLNFIAFNTRKNVSKSNFELKCFKKYLTFKINKKNSCTEIQNLFKFTLIYLVQYIVLEMFWSKVGAINVFYILYLNS